MASHTISQFGQHHGIVRVAGSMTAYTPTHIHELRLGNGHLADLAVAILAIQAGGNMRPVAVVDKVRQNRNRHPWDGCVIFEIHGQFIQFGVGCRFGGGFGDLLVAAITLGCGRQTRRLPSQSSWMAVQALDPQA